MFFIVTCLGQGRFHIIKIVFTDAIKMFPSRRAANQHAKGTIITPYKVFKYS